jgi:spore germination protein KA
LESGYIEELIEDNPYSPFPQLLETEKPDVTAAALLEGRIAILTDGTPFTLIAPTSLFQLLTPSEDYYNRWIVGNATRILRFFLVILSFTLPSFYIAITTFHQQMLPTKLILSFASAHELVPFPALIEALIMEVSFEALREAGVRLPKQVGAAVSIVGAIVIGEAAVMAGLISAPLVVVVAITGISNFIVAHYSLSLSFRLLRFPLMLLAGMMGLVGLMLGILALAVHLCTLRSFGNPYLAGAAPIIKSNMKDVWIRAPWWAMNKLPRLSGEADQRRQGRNQKPGPEDPLYES